MVAFEPEYANLHWLNDNLLINRLSDRVQVYALALSNRSGVSALHIHDPTPGAALHLESPERVDATRVNHAVLCREGVYAIRLDEFCEQTGLQPHCMKIDVDGTELAVLEGGLRTITSPQFRSLMIEMPEEPEVRHACIEWLLKAGLRCRQRPALGPNTSELWVPKSAAEAGVFAGAAG